MEQSRRKWYLHSHLADLANLVLLFAHLAAFWNKPFIKENKS
jgi:hypothetical protein